MGLEPRQIRAAGLLAKGETQANVGRIVGVNRKTIARWLQNQEFKNLSFGLVNHNVSPEADSVAAPKTVAAESVDFEVSDLSRLAVNAVGSVLLDSESSVAHKLRAAQLAGEWSGLSKNKMAELEAIKVLLEANWVPEELCEAVVEGGEAFQNQMQNAFRRVLSANGQGHEVNNIAALVTPPDLDTALKALINAGWFPRRLGRQISLASESERDAVARRLTDDWVKQEQQKATSA
jgi:hypothetical protein